MGRVARPHGNGSIAALIYSWQAPILAGTGKQRQRWGTGEGHAHSTRSAYGRRADIHGALTRTASANHMCDIHAIQARTGLLCARHMHRVHLTRTHPATTDSESIGRCTTMTGLNHSLPTIALSVAASQHQHTETAKLHYSTCHHCIICRCNTTASRPGYHGMTSPPFRECLSEQAFKRCDATDVLGIIS